MSDIIKKDEMLVQEESGLNEIIQGILLDVETNINQVETVAIPLEELSSLGMTIGAILPAFRTITQTHSIKADGLYRVANAVAGDTLKAAKNGNFWGALKTANGASKFAQLQEIGSVAGTTTTVMPINIVAILMAVALHSVEKRLENIAEIERSILDFLETDKKAEIEGDLETLTEIIGQYKYNWDNDLFISNNHHTVLDIKRQARRNILFYQKRLSCIFSNPKVALRKTMVNKKVNELVKNYRYYRISLFTYSLSSLLEILLSGNFMESNISNSVLMIKEQSKQYHACYEKGNEYLNSLLMKYGIGNSIIETVGKTFVTIINQNNQTGLDSSALWNENITTNNIQETVKNAITSFKAISDPHVDGLLGNMSDLISVFNHTKAICFDQNRVYLLSDREK